MIVSSVNLVKNSSVNNNKKMSAPSFGGVKLYDFVFGSGDPEQNKKQLSNIFKLRESAQRARIELIAKKNNMKNSVVSTLEKARGEVAGDIEQAKKIYSTINTNAFSFKDFMFSERYKLIKEGKINGDTVKVYAESSSYSENPLGGVFVIEKIEHSFGDQRRRVVSRFEDDVITAVKIIEENSCGKTVSKFKFKKGNLDTIMLDCKDLPDGMVSCALRAEKSYFKDKVTSLECFKGIITTQDDNFVSCKEACEFKDDGTCVYYTNMSSDKQKNTTRAEKMLKHNPDEKTFSCCEGVTFLPGGKEKVACKYLYATEDNKPISVTFDFIQKDDELDTCGVNFHKENIFFDYEIV